MVDPSITFRINPVIKAKIQEMVNSEQYRSVTDFIDQAIREKLAREELGFDPLDKLHELEQRSSDHEARLQELERKLISPPP